MRFRRFLGVVCGFAILAAISSQAAGPATSQDWLFVENRSLKLGILLSSGGGIAWLSEAGSSSNLVNHFDRGRLIQQSYYGRKDDSMWNKTPWSWNPVQGGDWRGNGAAVLSVTNGRTWLYAKTRPKHWAKGNDLDETLMEQWVTLEDDVAHVRYKFSYTGTLTHPLREQEIPAVFVNPHLSTLVLYDGARPWTGDTLHRSTPGWPNEKRGMTEHWAAYVDENNLGLGAYVPISTNLTCYRFGNGDPLKGACSYFSPLTRFSIKPGFTFEYDLYLTLGSVDAMRDRFRKLHQQRPTPPGTAPAPAPATKPARKQ